MVKPARIIKAPTILGGKPIIEGTRLAVWLIQEHVANGATEADLLKNYPRLTQEGITAALNYAEEHGMVPFEDWDRELCPRCRLEVDQVESETPPNK